MTFSLVISSARFNSSKDFEVNKVETEALIRKVFERFNFGEFEIDIVKATSRGMDCLKIFIHYISVTPNADQFRARLEENDARQKEGEIVPPIKVVYGQSREGRDQYWQVYKSKTRAERLEEQAARLAEQTAKTTEFTPRIEM
jgi:ribosomal protein S24E